MLARNMQDNARKHSRWSIQSLQRLTQLGFVLYIIASLAYLILGQLNADEGWYLYASRLVLQGKLPYQDFAYTQMPLSPYIYGVPQVLSSGLIVGRLTSIIISLGTVGMGIVFARRYAGARAGAMAAWLFVAFTFGIYANSIVKTYALVSFCFTATLFVLSSNLSEEQRFPLALLYAWVSVLVRVTAIFFLIPVLLYTLLAAKHWKTRLAILLECALIAVLGALLLFPDWVSARWGIFDSHLRHWAGAQAMTRILIILSQRVPDIVQNFGLALLLFGGAIFFLWRSRGLRALLSRHLPVAVTLLSLGLFMVSHLANGLWDIEYLVPAMTAFLPIMAIALSQVYTALDDPSRILVQGLVVAALFLFPFLETNQHIDLRGKRLPIAENLALADFIAQHSSPRDKILAMETLGAVVDAYRNTLPGMSLAQFSIQMMDAPTAQRLHVVNPAMLAEAVNHQAVRVVVLTEGDWGVLHSTDPVGAADLEHALDQHYHLAWSMSLFGQYASQVSVYLSN